MIGKIEFIVDYSITQIHESILQADLTFLPYVAKGPVKTPPIENYDSPDGDYVNTTRKYDGEE